jgi:CHAT domain-containing protein/predicted negative regulator of RcsB-dependent stress response
MNRFPVILVVLLFAVACSTPSIVATKEQKTGDDRFNAHRYEEALTHYRRMLEASAKLGIYRNTAAEAEVHRKIANCHEMRGAYDSALLHTGMAWTLDSAAGNRLGMIADCRSEGRNLIYSGLFRQSIAPLERSLALGEGMEQSAKGVHRQAVAGACLLLGNLYHATGQVQKALDCTGRSLDLFRQSRDRQGEMEALLSFAQIHADLGNVRQAETYLEQSEKLALSEQRGTARHHELAASLSLSAGRYEEALRRQEQALQEAEKHRIVSRIIWYTIGMGDIYHAIGDTARAERRYRAAAAMKADAQDRAHSLQASIDMRTDDVQAALSYFADEGLAAGEGISSLRMARLMSEKERPDSALLFAERALRLFSLSGNRQGRYNALLCEGEQLITLGRIAEAQTALDTALTAVDYPETLWQAWFHTGRAHEAQGNDGQAKEAYYRAVAVIERIRGQLTVEEFRSSYSDNKREVYDRLIRLLLKSGSTAEAFHLSEKARARTFYETLAGKTIRFRQSPPESLIMAEQEKRQEIQKLYRLLQRQPEAKPAQAGELVRGAAQELRELIEEKQTEYEDVLRKIKPTLPEYSELIADHPIRLSELNGLADAQTAILSYWLSDEAVVIWLTGRNGTVCKTVPVSRDRLNRLIEDTRNYISAHFTRYYIETLKELYTLLILPVEAETAGVTRLVVIPNGALHFLPFQTLIDGRGEYLVEKFHITCAPSASVYRLCLGKQAPRGAEFLGMALSDVSVDRQKGLPGTDAELQAILPFFPENVSGTGLQGTETFAKTHAPASNFIHFATHGMYNVRQPLYSCLLFPPSDSDDGHLNVFEIFEMDLHAKLVALSACETGIGQLNRGDELIGLSRAFLFAGSSSVMVSLWNVADRPTSLLMRKFYAYLETHPAAEALTLAQRDMRKQYPQPFYWAPFILIGNGNIAKPDTPQTVSADAGALFPLP